MNIIFTDGSSRGNPGPGGWGAVIALSYELEAGRVIEIGGREDHTTNNRMEMMAVIKSLQCLSLELKTSSLKLCIYTDSSYVLNGITKWIKGWEANGWMTKGKDAVMNSDLWQELSAAVEGKNINWKLVKGHSGVAGNMRCDEIATAFADDVSIDLYKGSAESYSVDLNKISSDMGEVKKSSSSSRKAAYSYISEIDGQVERHTTWADCEMRVKGAKGAHFKKVFSREEEQSLMNDWSKK